MQQRDLHFVFGIGDGVHAFYMLDKFSTLVPQQRHKSLTLLCDVLTHALALCWKLGRGDQPAFCSCQQEVHTGLVDYIVEH